MFVSLVSSFPDTQTHTPEQPKKEEDINWLALQSYTGRGRGSSGKWSTEIMISWMDALRLLLPVLLLLV